MEFLKDPKLPQWDDLFAARINDRVRQQDRRWAYGFVELFSSPGDGSLILADPGRSGTPTNSPAYALADASGVFEIGSIVHVRVRGACAGRPIFEIVSTIRRDAEEDGSGSSGSGRRSGSGSGTSQNCRITYVSGACLRPADGSGSGSGSGSDYSLDVQYSVFDTVTCQVVSRSCITDPSDCCESPELSIHELACRCDDFHTRLWPSRMYLSVYTVFNGVEGSGCQYFFGGVIPMDFYGSATIPAWETARLDESSPPTFYRTLYMHMDMSCVPPCIGLSGGYQCGGANTGITVVATILEGYQLDPFFAMWRVTGYLDFIVSEFDPNVMGPQPVYSPFRGETLPSSMTLQLAFQSGNPAMNTIFGGTWALYYDRGCWHPAGAPGNLVPFVVFSTEPGTLPRIVISNGITAGGGGEADPPGGRPMTWTGLRLIANGQEGVFNAVLSF